MLIGRSSNMTRHVIATICVLNVGIAIHAGVSHAGRAPKKVQEGVEKCKGPCLGGGIGISIASQFVSRGVVFEDDGRMLQPYADLDFKIHEGEGFLSNASITLGIWNSFHSRNTGAGSLSGAMASTTPSWFETDFTAGASFTVAKTLTVNPTYLTYLSPNDAFATFRGFNVRLVLDDTALLRAFALHPWIQVLFELQNKAGTGANEGVYYEIGLAPDVALGPITLTLPLTIGLGSGDFYGRFDATAGTVRNEPFGFFSAGATASCGLGFIPGHFGAWTVRAGYTRYHLGAGTSDFNTAARGSTVRDSRNSEDVFSGGIGLAF